MELIPSASDFLALRNGEIESIPRPTLNEDFHLNVITYMIKWITDWICNKNDIRDKLTLRLTHIIPRNIIADWEEILTKKGYFIAKEDGNHILSAYPIDNKSRDSLIGLINNATDAAEDELSALLNSVMFEKKPKNIVTPKKIAPQQAPKKNTRAGTVKK